MRIVRRRVTAASIALATALACSPPPDTPDDWWRLAGTDAWRPVPANPILRPGARGEWDEWAVMSMSVVRVGRTFHLYYEGGATGVGDLQVGHATSTDGLTWTKDPENPVLRPGAAGEWDDGATWDPFVLYEDGVFKMWYGGERTGHRDFQCGYATSTDGVHFEKKGKIGTVPDGEMADMHVVHDRDAGRYIMYYWDRHFEPAWRLRRAESPDETGFDFGRAAPIRIAISLDRASARASVRKAGSPPSTRPRPITPARRSAASGDDRSGRSVRSRRASSSRSSRRWVKVSTEVSGLFTSWATPAARRPMLACFSDCRSLTVLSSSCCRTLS